MRSLLFAGSLAALTTLAFACGSSEEQPAPACNGVEVLAAASDSKVSSFVCGLPGQCLPGVDLGHDPVLTATNGRAFFVARDNDVLFELDPSCGTLSAEINLDALAPRDAEGKRKPANPHDVAAAPDGTLVIPLYTVPKLAFVKNGAVDGELDLSSYDPDGNPQADAVSIVTVGGSPKAFVTLERLDDNGTTPKEYLQSRQPSQMLRVDVATRKPEAVIELEGRNPFNPMPQLDGALFLAEPGNFDAADDERAGIERFDTATSTTGLLVRERDLGASVVEISVTKGCGAAIVAGPESGVNPTSLVTFDPDTGRIIASVAAPLLGPTPGYDLYGLTWRGDTLYVGDRRRGANGYPIHVFQRSEGCALTATGRTIDLPQPPVALRPAH
ncbi:MAG TPA: hypothetical protein VM925_36590 [Labilithrix sp.]|nr:hypothetical protein [Labilithrix sp.]